ncbi:MAG TPA: hypothetical protein VH796_04855 [Nitrososphaeraceae archaeon]
MLHLDLYSKIEDAILDLRLSKRFGSNRIWFRLKRIIGISLSTRTIYKILKRHCLNMLKCQTKVRRGYKLAICHEASKRYDTVGYTWPILSQQFQSKELHHQLFRRLF